MYMYVTLPGSRSQSQSISFRLLLWNAQWGIELECMIMKYSEFPQLKCARLRRDLTPSYVSAGWLTYQQKASNGLLLCCCFLVFKSAGHNSLLQLHSVVAAVCVASGTCVLCGLLPESPSRCIIWLIWYEVHSPVYLCWLYLYEIGMEFRT